MINLLNAFPFAIFLLLRSLQVVPVSATPLPVGFSMDAGQAPLTEVDFDIINPEEEYRKLSEPLPSCKNDSPVCENVISYPYNEVKDILRRARNYSEFFGVDAPPEEGEIRNGDIENLCASRLTTIYPKAGLNKNKKWKYIVNQENPFVQGILIEKCMFTNEPCNFVIPFEGYITACTQKYIWRRLLSVDDDADKAEPDYFKVPSACACSIKKDPNYLSGFGKASETSPEPLHIF